MQKTLLQILGMNTGQTMYNNNQNYMKGMLAAGIAFLGLSFCSFPAPAAEPIKSMHKQIICMADNIYWEARNQPVKGMWAVAFVVDNRVEDSRFPNSHCEVIKQGPTSKWRFKKHGKVVPIRHRCQFSWYCDGKSDEIPSYDIDVYLIALAIAQKVFFGSYSVDITKGATHYHADYVFPAWRKQKTKTLKVANHIFYRWEQE